MKKTQRKSEVLNQIFFDIHKPFILNRMKVSCSSCSQYLICQQINKLYCIFISNPKTVLTFIKLNNQYVMNNNAVQACAGRMTSDVRLYCIIKILWCTGRSSASVLPATFAVFSVTRVTRLYKISLQQVRNLFLKTNFLNNGCSRFTYLCFQYLISNETNASTNRNEKNCNTRHGLQQEIFNRQVQNILFI